MINLLPRGASAQMNKMYKKRLAVCGLIFLFLAILVSIILMGPTILTARQKLIVVEADLANNLARPISKQADEISTLVKEANTRLTIFDTKPSTPSALQIVDRVFIHIIDDISVRNIDLDRESGAVKVRGLANKRNALLAFIKSFESDTFFVDVSSPISNLITTSNIEFYIDLKLPKNLIEKNEKK
jgi:hypothetical protein